MSIKASVEVTVGCMLRGKFRRMLNTSSRYLTTLTWTEEKGLLSSQFIIRGCEEEIAALKYALQGLED